MYIAVPDVWVENNAAIRMTLYLSLKKERRPQERGGRSICAKLGFYRRGYGVTALRHAEPWTYLYRYRYVQISTSYRDWALGTPMYLTFAWWYTNVPKP